LEIPDKRTREEIFKVHTKKMPLEKEVQLSFYIDKTKGWTGAEIESLCRNAGISAIKRVYQLKKILKLTITKSDFDKSLKEVSEQIGKKLEEKIKPLQKKDAKKVN